jgi:CDP-diacylglycerol--serine O-phosphatidyltransferase
LSETRQQLRTTSNISGNSRPGVLQGSKRPTILSFAFDWANLITLIGLASGLLVIYFALQGQFQAAILALLWAVLFDWFDGPVARRMTGRTENQKLFGANMDSLVDVISSAVAPGVLLLAYGEFSPWFYPGFLAIAVAGVLRLAYFDVYGVDSDGTIAGLSIDFTPLVVAGVFLAETTLSHDAFAGIFYGVILVMAGLHVAPFRMHKMAGIWVSVVTVYVVALTAVHSAILWVE